MFRRAIITLLVVGLLSCYNAAAEDSEWEDTDTTSSMWAAASRRDTDAVKRLVAAEDGNAFVRSADGRGPLFWAYEFGHLEGIALLEELGVDNEEQDVEGNTPKQLGLLNAAMNKQRDTEFAAQAAAQAQMQDDEYEYGDEDEEEDDGDEL